MPLSKESRNLGQKAAAISATAFALKSLGLGLENAGAPKFIGAVGAENAAAVAGLASILVTIYFLLRVWDERLALSYVMLVANKGAGTPEIIEDGDELEKNVANQQWVKGAIGFADFWVPLGLGITVAVLLLPDIISLFQGWYQHLINQILGQAGQS